MVTDINEKRIRGYAYELAAIAEEMQENSDDRDLVIELTTMLYEKAEKVVGVLLHTIPKDDFWMDQQFQRIALQRATTHRSEVR